MLRTLVLCSAAMLAACNGQTAVEPAQALSEESTSVTEPVAVPTIDEDIRRFLLQSYPDAGPVRYALATTDLDGDGADEAIVHLVGPYFCGSGGCNTLVLAPAGPMWRTVAEISVSRTPITVMDTSSEGWKDLTVAVGGGGGPSGTALLKFDGEAYPGNPTVAPAEMVDAGGTVLIEEEPEFVELEAAQPSAE